MVRPTFETRESQQIFPPCCYTYGETIAGTIFYCDTPEGCTSEALAHRKPYCFIFILPFLSIPRRVQQIRNIARWFVFEVRVLRYTTISVITCTGRQTKRGTRTKTQSLM